MPSRTRQGKTYNSLDSKTTPMAEEGGKTGINELLQMLIEDRRARNAEEARRNQERKEETERREREHNEDQTHHDREHDERVRVMQSQIDMMQGWMDRS